MQVKLKNQVYDLYNDLDRSQLEYLASLAYGKPTLQQFLLRETGVDITPAIASESQIEAFDQTYDMNKEADFQSYVKRLRAAEKARLAKLHQEIDTRIADKSDDENSEPKLDITEKTAKSAPEIGGISPEARRYYEMKDKTIPEYEGRKSQLAEWANNFKHLAQKNYDERLQRGDEMARRADLGLTPETFSQVFKDDKMMSIIEKEYTPASDYQVPDFDPSSTNLNTIDKLRPGNFEYDPNYVDFSRNNTVPKEVVSVMEQLGI